VKFRGSYNRAIRAPSVQELFLPPQENFPGYTDPCNAPASGPEKRSAKVLALCTAQIGAAFNDPTIRNTFQQTNAQTRSVQSGNLSLKPESADTFTVGTVWQPTFGEHRVRTSLDYWSYAVSNTIDRLSAASVVARCFNDAGANPTYDPNSVWCRRFTRDTSGDVTDVLQPTENLGKLKVNGVDLQVDYGAPLGQSWGKLNVNLLLTRLLKWDFQEDSLSPFGQFNGTVRTEIGRNYPKWKATVNLGWNFGQYDVNWNARYIDAVTVVNADATGTPVTVGLKPNIPSFVYHRVNGSWHPTEAFVVTVGVDNVFDKKPPVYTDDGRAGVQANTDPSTYDVLGRRFFLFGQYKF
jgi:outer membrane receptor protein involved in Fe transport